MICDAGMIGKDRKKTALWFFWLFVISVLAYSYSLDLPFMCDDYYGFAALSGQGYYPPMDTVFYNIYDYITPSVNREFPQIVPWWTSPDTKLLFLRPLTSLALKLDYLIWNKNAFGFHLSNIVIHGLACAFLFMVGRLLFKRNLVAAIAALIFIGHMYNAFVVPWSAERSSVLSMLLGLMGLYGHILYRSGKSWVWEVLAWFAFILAFLSRESGATCLITYFLFDFFIWRKECPEKWPGIILNFLYYALLSIPLFLFMAYFVKAGYGVVGYYSILQENQSFWAMASYIVKNVFLYIESLLFFNLLGNETNIQLFQKWYYYGPFIVMAIAAVILFYPGFKRKLLYTPISLFLLSWLFIAFLPILYLLTQNRYMYPATAPFGLFISYYLFEVIRLKGFGKPTKPLAYAYIIFLTVLPLVGMNIKHGTFTKIFSFQGNMVKATQPLLEDAETPVNVYFINMPSPLYSMAVQQAFDFYMGKGTTRIFPLTMGHDVPEVTVLGDQSIEVISHSHPYLENPGEKLFMSGTESPNRVGYSMGNQFVKGTVTGVEDGKIYSFRFDFPSPLNADNVRLLYMKDRNVHRIDFPGDIEPGQLLAPRKSSRE